MAKLPHILICGYPGTGKTAFVQTMITTLAYQKGKETVQFAIYDSKGVDYEDFGNLPHLYKSIDILPAEGIEVINVIGQEVRNRYNKLISAKCRDREAYNKYCVKIGKPEMSSLFLILDDFSSINIGKTTLPTLLEILQNGRIAGVHVIFVVSNVNNKTIQKEILSYVPCKISFCLSTKNESKIVFEDSGAENLYVPGEMLFKNQNEVLQCQASFVDKASISTIVRNVNSTSVNAFKRIEEDIKKIMDEDLPDIELTSIEKFTANNTTYWIEDNKVCIERNDVLDGSRGFHGTYTVTSSVKARAIEKIVFKQAKLFSKGFIQFVHKADTKLEENTGRGATVLSTDYRKELINKNTTFDGDKMITTYDFNSSSNSIMKSFVELLHEDAGILIEEES